MAAPTGCSRSRATISASRVAVSISSNLPRARRGTAGWIERGGTGRYGGNHLRAAARNPGFPTRPGEPPCPHDEVRTAGTQHRRRDRGHVRGPGAVPRPSGPPASGRALHRHGGPAGRRPGAALVDGGHRGPARLEAAAGAAGPGAAGGDERRPRGRGIAHRPARSGLRGPGPALPDEDGGVGPGPPGGRPEARPRGALSAAGTGHGVLRRRRNGGHGRPRRGTAAGRASPARPGPSCGRTSRMRVVIGWRPYDPWPSPVREMLDQFFREVGVRDRGVSAVPINVYEEEEALVIEASMPGVRPEDIELSCVDDVLTIRGRSSVPDREYLHQEMHRTEYLRRVPLPAGCSVDGAEASTELGLLRIRVPKPRPRAPERIRIQITRKNSS